PPWRMRDPRSLTLVSGQPGTQRVQAVADRLLRDVLVIRVRQQRVARAEVHRRDPEGGEAGHVGPAVLGLGILAQDRDQLRGNHLVEAWTGAVRAVGAFDVESLEELA